MQCGWCVGAETRVALVMEQPSFKLGATYEPADRCTATRERIAKMMAIIRIVACTDVHKLEPRYD